MARTAEQGHTKACLAAAMIAAIQNLRDSNYLNDHEFRLDTQGNVVLTLADAYLEDGIVACTCPPFTKYGE